MNPTRACSQRSTKSKPKRYSLPFAHLNLRRNPFEELTPELRGRLAVVDTAPYLEFLKAERATLVFIGHCGRGKSTHLHALRLHFPEAPYCYLPEDGPQPKIPKAPLLFVDETQRLSWWRRWRLFAGSSRLILGTHCNEIPALKRAGRPVMKIEIQGLSEEKLQRIIEARLEWSRRGPGEIPSISEDQRGVLLAHFGDNIRALEYHLYEVFQSLQDNGPIDLDPDAFPEMSQFAERAHD